MKRVERIVIVCQHCRTEFMERASRRRKFCSKACEGKASAERYAAARPKLTCQHCGNEFVVKPHQIAARYCSLQCKQVHVSRSTADKRSAVMRAKTPQPKPTTYLKSHGRHIHRIVAEQMIGRPLQPGEIVHHKDENRHNNAPNNLEIMYQPEHARHHSTKGRKCSIDGCGRKHAGKGFCQMHWRRDRKEKQRQMKADSAL